MYRLGGVYHGVRVLREETARAAVQPRVKSGETTWYGLGWMVRADGSYYHTGSDGTMAWIDPARETIGMVLTQSPGGRNPTAEFQRLIAEAVRR